MSKRKRKESPWYSDGLYFRCTECGNCCTGAPGYVDFTAAELEAMARHLDLLPDEFLRTYARRRRGWWSLKEVEVDEGYDCVFLRRDPETGRALCEIYEVRPAQCRTWPFWPENLKSLKAWESAARGCPGMDNDGGRKGPGGSNGSFFPLEEIRKLWPEK